MLLKKVGRLQTTVEQHRNHFQEILPQVEKHEEKIRDCVKDGVRFAAKCERIGALDEDLKAIDESFEQMHKQVAASYQNAVRLETYLDKYLNIRVQNAIGTTLRACLTGYARKAH